MAVSLKAQTLSDELKATTGAPGPEKLHSRILACVRPGGNRDRLIALTFRRARSVDKLQIAMG